MHNPFIRDILLQASFIELAQWSQTSKEISQLIQEPGFQREWVKTNKDVITVLDGINNENIYNLILSAKGPPPADEELVTVDEWFEMRRTQRLLLYTINSFFSNHKDARSFTIDADRQELNMLYNTSLVDRTKEDAEYLIRFTPQATAIGIIRHDDGKEETIGRINATVAIWKLVIPHVGSPDRIAPIWLQTLRDDIVIEQ